MGIELAKKVDADVIMATDPDADRLGIYVKEARESGRTRNLQMIRHIHMSDSMPI